MARSSVDRVRPGQTTTLTDSGRAMMSTDGASQAPVIDVKDVDWNRVWQAQRAKQSYPKRDARFWDRRAPAFAKAVSGADYADQFLAILKPENHWSVLDVGCGNGTLAIPLSKLVSSITAIDLSQEMLKVVQERCEAEGIKNITIIHGRWEDVWGNLGIRSHDIAVASRSMVVDDLRTSILKLDAIARKRVYVVTIVGDGPYDRHLFDVIERPLNVGPDYICNYNMLYQMGIYANVAFIEDKRIRTYNSPKEVLDSVRWMFSELTPAEEDKLKTYLKERLVFNSGSWKLTYERLVRWAVMWWDKE